MIQLLRFLPWAGWPLAIMLGVLWLEARDDVIRERESCNSEKLVEAIESERMVAAEREAADQREIERLRELVERERQATAIANEAAELANSRTETVRTIVEEVDDACMDSIVPADVLDSVYAD